MNRLKQLSGCISLALLSLALLFGCGKKNSKGNGGNPDRQEFALGVMASVDYLPFAVALDKGIYDSLGLDLRLEHFFSPVERDAALQGGVLDGAVTDYTSAALLNAAQLPIVLDMKCDGAFRLIVGQGKSIATLQDLRGKRLALSSNTVIEYTTDKLLAQAGIAPEEVEKVEIVKIPLRLEMLRNGEVDAAVLPEPFATMALESGLTSLISTKELGINLTGIALTREASERKEAVNLLHQGYNLGVQYMQQHPREEWVKVLISELGISKTAALSMELPDFTPATIPTPQELEEMNRWLKGKKLVDEGYSTQQLLP